MKETARETKRRALCAWRPHSFIVTGWILLWAR